MFEVCPTYTDTSAYDDDASGWVAWNDRLVKLCTADCTHRSDVFWVQWRQLCGVCFQCRILHRII